ncbi:hypothetical protein [Mesorhizobium sp.]|uniref:hypothetical protein n=1 Tax=Mesorhizobium sp. TaxID=1871066 RepID=UPI000FE92E2A|nr:hypothetical protein [Mesorhizobium sp.]RWB69723.1 MAG: hypothetical protein EOQ49_19805 [Mesorhizobium sp.]
MGRFADLPIWAKIGFGFVVASLLLFLVALGIYQASQFYRIRANFDHVYNEAMRKGGAQFQSSHNRLLELPQHIRQSNDGKEWAGLSQSFSKHITFIEDFYAPLAACLVAETCWPRERHGEFCRVAAAEALSVAEITRRLKLVIGINIVLGNEDDAFGGVFGPSFNLPNLVSLKTIADGPCAEELSQQRQEQMSAISVDDAKAGWAKLVERGVPLEMRDFPFDYPAAAQVVTDAEFDAAIRKAGDVIRSDIKRQLCAQQQDMVAGTTSFSNDGEQKFPNYYLSPTCRLEEDGSRKCTWPGFYKSTQRVITGFYRDTDEERQIEYLRDMFEDCPVPHCAFNREASYGGQNALGFACKELVRLYSCERPPHTLSVDLTSCFDYGSLKIGTLQ